VVKFLKYANLQQINKKTFIKKKKMVDRIAFFYIVYQERPMEKIDDLCIKTIRFLAVDAVTKAKSGHPGMPLGAAPMAYALWSRHLRFNPKNPNWSDRDRFILSGGHASALLYSLLHLFGYDLPLEEIKQFRQWGSKTPGHPEYGDTPGVEATTGPLGQGISMAVGMAIAEKFLAKTFNKENLDIINHHTYVIASDGDLMEGVSSEACSLAGTLKLNKLIVLYDKNNISIEGDTDMVFTENVEQRYKAYRWDVNHVKDGEDIEKIDKAIDRAKNEKEKPSIIIINTHIGYGSPKQDTGDVHGSPLSEEEVRETKRNLDWPEEPYFLIPEEALNNFKKYVVRGEKLEKEWNDSVEKYKKEYSNEAINLENSLLGELPVGWDSGVPEFQKEDGAVATRKVSGKVLNALAPKLLNLIGGSADLAPSNKTIMEGFGDFSAESPESRNLHFGVREHAMGAIVNGMVLHGGVIPYGATFLIFSDYMKPALRLAALMKCKSKFIFTHDSIGLGEDGPTHQPVEHLMSLRAIPDMTVIRPADANETAAAWKTAIESIGPVSLILTRQSLPILDLKKYNIKEGVRKGAYILEDSEEKPEIILIGTGSEVHLALEAAQTLKKEGKKVRVVSMPSFELFEKQDSQYKNSILIPGIPKLAIEAGVTLGWCKYVGDNGDVLGLDRFGASAPGKTVFKELGFSVENIIKKANKLLSK
jgi:transketolase